MALAELAASGAYQIAALLSTVTEGYERVSMHGVRRVLLEQQAAAVGLPLHVVSIPQDATNDAYQSRMEEAFSVFRRDGLTTIAFGDLFLADIRQYREEWLTRQGMRALFPIWKRETRALAHAFIDGGYEGVVACCDGRVLGRSFAGRRFDRGFLADLPEAVDPCGENGEFHTFVSGGPVFRHAVRFHLGAVVQRGSWYFQDLVPAV